MTNVHRRRLGLRMGDPEMPTLMPPTPLFPPRSPCPAAHLNCSHPSAASDREKEAIGSDDLVSGLEGSPQKTCECALRSRRHSGRRGRRVARVGPTCGARGAGGLALRPPSPNPAEPTRAAGLRPATPQEGGRGELPAPETEPHALAGPGA